MNIYKLHKLNLLSQLKCGRAQMHGAGLKSVEKLIIPETHKQLLKLANSDLLAFKHFGSVFGTVHVVKVKTCRQSIDADSKFA